MTDANSTVNVGALDLDGVAQLLCVSPRMVRNYIKNNDLPVKADGRDRRFSWPDVLEWFISYRQEKFGSDGNRARKAPQPVEEETYESALARKTRAEADLKELQLAKARGEVAAIGDVEKVLAASNLSVQTQMLAVPSRLASQLLGIEDHGRAVAILEAEMRQVLSNLAKIDAVREAAGVEVEVD